MLKLKCDEYVLCLDPDKAGRKGTQRLSTFLQKHKRKNIKVALLPEGKDVNDLSQKEFNNLQLVPLEVWRKIYSKELNNTQ